VSSDRSDPGRSDRVDDPDPSEADARPEPDGFGRAGWLLAAAVIGCTLVIPGIIYVYPYAVGVFDLGFFGTYLALPMVPAVLLGLIAVWTMTAAAPDRSDSESGAGDRTDLEGGTGDREDHAAGRDHDLIFDDDDAGVSGRDHDVGAERDSDSESDSA
jgi:hypothetical protein